MPRKITAGAAIRDARIKAGLSVAELSERSGVHLATLYRIESGSYRRPPQMATLRRLAVALAATPAELLGDEGVRCA